MNNTSVRIISALVLSLAILASYYFFNKNGLQTWGFLLSALCIFEYAKMFFATWSYRIIFMTFAVLNFVTFYLLIPLSIYALSLSFILLSIAVVVRAKKIATAMQDIGYSAVGIVYVGILPALFCRFFIRHPDGITYLLLCLICVASTDIFAFFFGKWLGKKPLHASLSPKKTVEGAVIGSLASVHMGLSTAYLLGLNHNYVYLGLTFLIASIFGQFGDLFESMLKRSVQVKDSGIIMPGHGGALDRLDSLLFAAPVFFVYANLTSSTFV